MVGIRRSYGNNLSCGVLNCIVVNSRVITGRRNQYTLVKKYRYLITKAVFTSWKMFLFMYSLDTGIGFPAIKEEVWFKLDEYLNKTKVADLGDIPKDKTEQTPMVPSSDLVVASKTGVSNVLTGAVSKEIIDATVEKYKAKEELTDAEIDAMFCS